MNIHVGWAFETSERAQLTSFAFISLDDKPVDGRFSIMAGVLHWYLQDMPCPPFVISRRGSFGGGHFSTS